MIAVIQTEPIDNGIVLFDEDYRAHIARLERKIAWLERKLWESRELKSQTKKGG